MYDGCLKNMKIIFYNGIDNIIFKKVYVLGILCILVKIGDF